MSDVLFRGPMLLYMQGKETSMRIPDGMKQLPGSKHPDGDPARSHFAGLFVATIPTVPPQVPPTTPATKPESLDGVRVTITEKGGSGVKLDNSLNAMVDLKERTSSAAAGPLTPISDDDSFFARGAAIVKFVGGMLSADADKLTSLTYSIPDMTAAGTVKTQRIPMLIRWTPIDSSNGVTIEIVKAGVTKTIDLEKDETACVYNWDVVLGQPTPSSFMDFKAATCTGSETEIVDVDFKWLYELFTPPADDWSAWRKTKMLPAPISPCALSPQNVAKGPKTSPSKDCLGGRWAG